jgi:hypothetical protein
MTRLAKPRAQLTKLRTLTKFRALTKLQALTILIVLANALLFRLINPTHLRQLQTKG